VAELELVVALLVVRVGLLLVGAGDVVVDERTGDGEDDVDACELDRAGRVLGAVLDATADVDGVRELPDGRPWVELAGSDWLTGTGPPLRAPLCLCAGVDDDVVAPACRFGMVGVC